MVLGFTVVEPVTRSEWQDYYELRWKILRHPWKQPRGSEKDDLEAESTHRMAVVKNKVIGVGRLHCVDRSIVQIRFMAVDAVYQNESVGSTILEELELSITDKSVTKICLHSREAAIEFYRKHGYHVMQRSFVLYGDIAHYRMEKFIN